MMKAKIISRETQADRVAILTLSAVNGELPQFSAGAHIDIHVHSDLVRQYSLCGDPANSNMYKVGVLNDPSSRGGSSAIFTTFSEGDVINISHPRNHFALVDEQDKAILIGGGIGITPILSMAYQLKANNKAFEIHYCIKSTESAAFIEEIKDQFPEQLTLYSSRSTPSKRFDSLAFFTSLTKTEHLYVCGPSLFMDAVIANAKASGFSSSHIHYEYFSADVETAGDAFEVVCESSGVTVRVGENQTIAEALKGAGIPVQVSCEEGVCGTCITDVITGEPDHRDKFLSDQEKMDNDQIAICCSRSKSQRLVLDI